eukprot:tig00020510_g9870.t1
MILEKSSSGNSTRSSDSGVAVASAVAAGSGAKSSSGRSTRSLVAVASTVAVAVAVAVALGSVARISRSPSASKSMSKSMLRGRGRRGSGARLEIFWRERMSAGRRDAPTPSAAVGPKSSRIPPRRHRVSLLARPGGVIVAGDTAPHDGQLERRRARPTPASPASVARALATTTSMSAPVMGFSNVAS